MQILCILADLIWNQCRFMSRRTFANICSNLVFCFQNCSDLLWEKKWVRKTFEIRSWRPKICKCFEITRTIYSKSEPSEQFLKQNYFLTYLWSFLRTIRIPIGQNNWGLILFRNKHEKLENLFLLLIIFNWNIMITLYFIFLQVCTTLLWNQVKSKMEA